MDKVKFYLGDDTTPLNLSSYRKKNKSLKKNLIEKLPTNKLTLRYRCYKSVKDLLFCCF